MTLTLQQHPASLILVTGLAALLSGCEAPDPCPQEMNAARRLVVIETPSMNGPAATLETFERRDVKSPWVQSGDMRDAVVGAKGVAWGWGFQTIARGGEPLKVEGDKRTPAGVFRFGSAFGFAPQSYPGYLRLEENKHLCVDDAKSPYYSQIVPSVSAGEATSGEKMWAIEFYKRGLVVDYPTNREARAGSCIFVHIWAGADQGTSGCVAAAEDHVEDMQKLAAEGETWIAVLPHEARDRFKGCVPSGSR